MHPTLEFLPGKFHGKWNLMGWSTSQFLWVRNLGAACLGGCRPTSPMKSQPSHPSGLRSLRLHSGWGDHSQAHSCDFTSSLWRCLHRAPTPWFPKGTNERNPKMEVFLFYNLLLEMTEYYYGYMLLITQTSPGKTWEGVTHGRAYQEAEVIGVSLRLATPFQR